MRAHARINLDALRHNLQRVRELAPQSRVLAVIKANGYGHGMIEVAQALDSADSYAVAAIGEALMLRQAGIEKDIVVLQGASDETELLQASQANISLVVHSETQLHTLETSTLPSSIDIWIKIDTGMHRLGFEPQSARSHVKRLQQCDHVSSIRIMSHFANADDSSDALTSRQLQDFLECSDDLGLERSIANSAGICASQNYHLDWVRPGIMLYGANPFLVDDKSDCRLQAVMTLSSHLISVQQRKRGDAIGYGGSWVCPQDMPVGVVSIGYGDGYPRHARAGTPVLVNGIKVPLVGRVSMDMICVDLRPCPQAVAGDEVILWGDGLPVEEVADSSDTIAYELLCKLTGRVQFCYE